MLKKLLFLIVGFGMITAGVAGIATSLVDQKNEAALSQLERIQDEAKAAAAEEQRKIEKKKHEIDKLAMSVAEERQRLSEERRRAQAILLAREAAAQEQKKAPAPPRAVSPKASAKAKGIGTDKKRTVLSRKQQEPAKGKVSDSGPRGSLTSKASKHDPQDADIKRISHRAGLEAARLLEPVEYLNRGTGELILAEPLNSGPGSVRVRIRVWRNHRLVKDNLMSFSEASLGGSSKPRA